MVERIKKNSTPKKRGPRITAAMKAWARVKTRMDAQDSVKGATINPFQLQPIPPGVIPEGTPTMAMDDNIQQQNQWSGQNATAFFGGLAYISAYQEGLAFPGYPFLAELAQRPEYRRISETLAMEMTRKWIKITSTGHDDRDRQDAITAIHNELDRLRARDVVRQCIELDGFFGRSHLYVDTGDTHNRDELKTPLCNDRGIPLAIKFPQGKLKRLKAVEPVWTYPTNYDSIDPLTEQWYDPETWFVMGKEVHKTRLLKFVGREVPDLLKPAYSFGGLSMSQMALPYVNNWLRTRQSVADIIHAFSVFVLATDMSQTLQESGNELFDRADWFNWVRDNKGMMLIDKDSEEFQNVSASLASLDALQAQTQEHMASVSGIPIVKLLGIQPAGLNASSEGELRSFFDWILAMQEKMIRPHLTTIIDMCMLNLWGKIDNDITFNFEPLWSLDEKGMAEVRATEAETGIKLVEGGIISQLEERKRIANDPDSEYSSIDVEDVPDLRQEEEQGLEPKSGAAKIAEGAAAEQGEIEPPKDGIDDPQGHETGTGMQDGEDTEPLFEKTPYLTKTLRPDYVKGKNPLLHRFLKGKNPISGAELEEKLLDPAFLKEMIAGLQDQDVDQSSLDINAGEGTGGSYERDTSIGSEHLPGKELDDDFLRNRVAQKNAANPDRYEDDEQRGSPHNRDIAMRAIALLRRRKDAQESKGRNERIAGGQVRIPGRRSGNNSTGGLRREASAQKSSRGNEDDEVGRWGNWAEDGLAHDEGEFEENDHPRDADGKFTSGGGGSSASSSKGGKFTEGTYKPKPKLSMSSLKKVGGQLGSNAGGKYEDDAGNKYYIKKGKSKAHVSNEYLAADLFKATGARTQKYRDVEGGDEIATEWENYDKNNAKDFNSEERKEAQKLFAVHAWLANWDAAGLDYDNQAIEGGKAVALDLGGALEYRAQGAPKGDKFGKSAGEWDTMRDSKINPQNAKLFGGMSNEDLKKSAKMVDRVSDAEIYRMVEKRGKPKALAEKLIERKRDIGMRAAALEADGKPQDKGSTVVFNKYGDNPKELNGIPFKEWKPEGDWADVEGQIELEDDSEPELKKWQRLASGLVIEEEDGRVWLASPTGGYGGYEQTFPKGGVERGLSMQANAIKEAFEETGIKAEITGHYGDFEGDTSVTRYYKAKRVGGDPSKHGWESEGVILAPKNKLESLLNRSRDKKIAAGLASDEFVEADHPREADGKFSKYNHTIGLAGQGESGKAVKSLFEELGFSKGDPSKSGKHRFVSNNLDVVVVEPPKSNKANPKAKEGATPWSSLWTLYPKDGDIISGKGNKDLQKELEKLKSAKGAGKKPTAEEKKEAQPTAKEVEKEAVVEKETEGDLWKTLEGEGGVATITLKDEGFVINHNGNEQSKKYNSYHEALEDAEKLTETDFKGENPDDKEDNGNTDDMGQIHGKEGTVEYMATMGGYHVQLYEDTEEGPVAKGKLYFVDSLENAKDIGNALAKGFLDSDQDIYKQPGGEYGVNETGKIKINNLEEVKPKNSKEGSAMPVLHEFKNEDDEVSSKVVKSNNTGKFVAILTDDSSGETVGSKAFESEYAAKAYAHEFVNAGKTAKKEEPVPQPKAASKEESPKAPKVPEPEDVIGKSNFTAEPADLEKAKKTTPFYYPQGVPPQAQNLVNNYNKMYEGKQLSTKAELTQKVKDYKAVKQIVDQVAEQHMSEQQKAQKAAQAEQQKKAAEQQAKAQAEHAEEQKKLSGQKTMLTTLKKNRPSPNTKQMSAIKSYSGGGYSSMNDSLRHGNEGIQPGSNIAHLKSYLDTCSTDHDAVVYRKVSGDYAKILSSVIEEGTIFKDKGFMSTAPTPGTWSGSMQMVITTKKGAKGTPINDWSNHPGENEILFNAGSRLKVTKIEGKESGFQHGRIHVELLND